MGRHLRSDHTPTLLAHCVPAGALRRPASVHGAAPCETMRSCTQSVGPPGAFQTRLESLGLPEGRAWSGRLGKTPQDRPAGLDTKSAFPQTPTGSPIPTN